MAFNIISLNKFVIAPLILFIMLSTKAQTFNNQNIALKDGLWFNGQSFLRQDFYSVDGKFTKKKPLRIDTTIDLRGTYIVPPFAEAHNHNIDGAVTERSAKAVRQYIADGVFYVKIQGNYPVNAIQKKALNINEPLGPDVLFAQGFVTASNGHPAFMHEKILLRQGYYPGLTKDSLQGKLYFLVDSEADLEQNWPQILQEHPDFIKATLWCSDEYDKRKNDTAFAGRKGLHPALLERLVIKAHKQGIRVSVHITNAADFRNALLAGADEIAHSFGPGFFKNMEQRGSDTRFLSNADTMTKLVAEALSSGAYIPLTVEDAKRAAKQGTTVVTTLGIISRSPEAVRFALKDVVSKHLQLLLQNGVRLIIGSDNPGDTSPKEAEGLQWLGVFDNSELLKMWTETTPQAIFPKRKIGKLTEGYEASFLALEGNPLDDIRNVRKISLRFKQGYLLPTTNH